MDFEKVLGKKVLKADPVAGGDIGRSFRVTAEDGEYFIKHYSRSGVAEKEARGLQEMAEADSIKVASVVAYNEHLIVLRFIKSAPRCADFQSVLGRRLAGMHRKTAEAFGFDEDNYCGSTPQPNAWKSTWAEFFCLNRLGHQVRLASDSALSSAWGMLERKIPDILAGTEEAPSLIHGDLWAGNVISDENGEPVLIDPAAYYGHREMELGMTALFGGFSSEFYRAYDEEFPLKPGWRERQDLYILYHVLNHYNLFGGGYRGQALGIIKKYI